MGPSLKFSSTFLAARKPVNFPCIHGTFCRHLSTFLESAGPSVKFPWVHGIFRQHSLHPRDLPGNFHASAGPSVNISCLRRTFGRLQSNLVRLQDLLSTFCVSPGSFIRFPYGSRTFCQVLTAFRTSIGPFVNFRQLFVHPQYLPSTSVNISWTSVIFRKQSAWPQNLPSALVDFPCICRTYCKLASTFREAGWPSVNIPCIRRTYQLCSTSLYYSVVQAIQVSFLTQTHKIFSYDSWYFHYSVVRAVRLYWTSLN